MITDIDPFRLAMLRDGLIDDWRFSWLRLLDWLLPVWPDPDYLTGCCQVWPWPGLLDRLSPRWYQSCWFFCFAYSQCVWWALHPNLPLKGNSSLGSREMTSPEPAGWSFHLHSRSRVQLLYAAPRTCLGISTQFLNDRMATSTVLASTFRGSNDLFTNTVDYKVTLADSGWAVENLIYETNTSE